MNRKKDSLYYYSVKLKRVIDGDTIVVDLDRGHNRWDHDVEIRLSSINAPEEKGTTKIKGQEAEDFLISLIDSNRSLIVRTKKSDNFARFIGHLYVEDDAHDTDIDVNETMVETGHAVPFMIDINL